MAAQRAHLAAVEGKKTAKKTSSTPRTRKKSVTQAASRGTRRELLEAMRARIAKAVEAEGTSARDLGTLVRSLDQVDAEIRAIDERDAELAEEDRADEDTPDEDFDGEAI